MTQLIHLFWQVCLLRKGPQDVPSSLFLLVVAITMNGLVAWGQLSMQEPALQALTETLALLGVSLAFVFLVLQIRGLQVRYVQTTTAWLFSTTIVILLVWPIVHLIMQIMEQYEQTSFPFLWANLSVLILVIFANIWSLLISAHILRHAVNASFWVGLMLALGMIALHILAFNVLQ